MVCKNGTSCIVARSAEGFVWQNAEYFSCLNFCENALVSNKNIDYHLGICQHCSTYDAGNHFIVHRNKHHMRRAEWEHFEPSTKILRVCSWQNQQIPTLDAFWFQLQTFSAQKRHKTKEIWPKKPTRYWYFAASVAIHGGGGGGNTTVGGGNKSGDKTDTPASQVAAESCWNSSSNSIGLYCNFSW